MASSPSSAGSSLWRSPLLSLQSAAFGVAGSGAAKLALTDAWTDFFVDEIIAAVAWVVACSSNGEAVRVAGDGDAATTANGASEAIFLSALCSHRLVLFYSVRVALVLVKLYLDSRMLHLFVRSMHASSSLMASAFNQCFSVVLAGVWGATLFDESLPRSWLVGAACILVGVCLVQWGNSDSDTDGGDDGVQQAQPGQQEQAAHGAAQSSVAEQRTDEEPNATHFDFFAESAAEGTQRRTRTATTPAAELPEADDAPVQPRRRSSRAT